MLCFMPTGREPNIEPVKLENTDIQITGRGAIQVDKALSN